MAATSLRSKDMLGLEGLSKDEIELVLDTADSMKEIGRRDIKKVPTLRGKTVVNLFFEASTRTRTSFEIAAKRLSADTVNISNSTSSVTKGETLIDTAKNIEAMSPNAIVIRHSESGAPNMLADLVKCSVINAGDGAHEHPSQGLLDLYTVRERKGRIEGLKIAIVGDIEHSRVARSDMIGFAKMGASVRVAGPPTMIPRGIKAYDVEVHHELKSAVAGVDVIMMLRIQLERQAGFLMPNTREYSRFYGLGAREVALAKKDVIIMHPGPLNRGVEISTEVADGPYSVILDQVNNGVAVRMALLYLLIGGTSASD
jgi:aspartate carbamoyltransferase catalytic subunit